MILIIHLPSFNWKNKTIPNVWAKRTKTCLLSHRAALLTLLISTILLDGTCSYTITINTNSSKKKKHLWTLITIFCPIVEWCRLKSIDTFFPCKMFSIRGMDNLVTFLVVTTYRIIVSYLTKLLYIKMFLNHSFT